MKKTIKLVKTKTDATLSTQEKECDDCDIDIFKCIYYKEVEFGYNYKFKESES